jgi:ABC-type branched-subunit amino acid transport system substrate-binding protein
MRKSFRTIGASMAVGVLALTATVATGGTASAAKNTSPIVVGGVWSASTYTGADVGAKAAFNAFNAAGGLGGRKIKFVGMQDDGQNPTSDIAAAKALVNEHVLAVVPVVTEAWVAGKVLQQAGIPYFGWGISTGWWQSSNGFSFVGAVPPNPKDEKQVRSVATEICLTVKGGCKGKTVALAAINNASAINSLQLFAAEWKKEGAKVVAQVSSIPEPPAVVSDYTPYVNQLMTSNNGKQPDFIQQVLPPEDDVAIIAQLNHSGFKGTDYNFSLYDPRAAAVAKGSDTLVTFAPWEQSSAAVAQMTKDVKATDPNVILGQPTEAGYWSAEMLIAALKKVGPSVTSASLTAALNKGWTFSVPGGTGPATFPAAHTGPGGCGSIVSSNGQKYSVVLPLTCVPLTKNPLLG